MNREILFRAKRKGCKELSEWIFGYYVHTLEGDYIVKPTKSTLFGERIVIEIDPDTICQYTGLTDKNGNKIWENDLLEGFEYPYLYDGEHNYFAQVGWSPDSFAFGTYTRKYKNSDVRGISEGNTELMEDFDSNKWEIIGNIFDNKELIE